MSWTQPICDFHWEAANPDRVASRLIEPVTEQCCICGEATHSGIYIRIDPKSVRFPRLEK